MKVSPGEPGESLVMTDRVYLEIAGDRPKFLCRVHGCPMHENKGAGRHECSVQGCNQIIDFHDLQKIAQWLRGYA